MDKQLYIMLLENGQIDVTKWLTDQGCSPWVKTKEGKTPYDLVTISRYDIEERKRKKEEVMDFLKTVMLQTPEVTTRSGDDLKRETANKGS
ncbi:Hypothetical predicted protein [Mytilus galloprovincialis]|uniref:Uncharacterized protein n=1 Tax=Mytilus galloprovincialis TaxID=29158 RepID=A0A8B6BWI8_MYTGA|nr:Hypothetical predicted protein [Mytilus galloprovincialis]